MSVSIATRGIISSTVRVVEIEGIPHDDLEVEIDVNYAEALPVSDGYEYLPNKRFVEEVAPDKKAISFPLPKHL